MPAAEFRWKSVRVVGVAVKVCVGASGVKLVALLLRQVRADVIELPFTTMDALPVIENFVFAVWMQLPVTTRVPPIGVDGQPARL